MATALSANEIAGITEADDSLLRTPVRNSPNLSPLLSTLKVPGSATSPRLYPRKKRNSNSLSVDMDYFGIRKNRSSVSINIPPTASESLTSASNWQPLSQSFNGSSCHLEISVFCEDMCIDMNPSQASCSFCLQSSIGYAFDLVLFVLGVSVELLGLCKEFQ